MRLDRFLANLPELSRRDAQMLIAGGRLRVDGQVVRDGTHEVRVFSRVELDEQLLQAGKPARYYMLGQAHVRPRRQEGAAPAPRAHGRYLSRPAVAAGCLAPPEC